MMSENITNKTNLKTAPSMDGSEPTNDATVASVVTHRHRNRTSTTSTTDDNACVVCFKNLNIYSIGECDHPVCYECSTRMRVLCQQNECPICRQVLSKVSAFKLKRKSHAHACWSNFFYFLCDSIIFSKVIFTYDKMSYRELEAKNRSEFYNKKYKIGFYTKKIQHAFYDLLDHQCPK